MCFVVLNKVLFYTYNSMHACSIQKVLYFENCLYTWMKTIRSNVLQIYIRTSEACHIIRIEETHTHGVIYRGTQRDRDSLSMSGTV